MRVIYLIQIIKKWLVLVDGTELDERKRKLNEYYLSRTYNKGEDKEFTKYHRSVLEAKIYFGNNLVCNIATDLIENSERYQNRKTTKEAMKQAFERLSVKLKKRFPRLLICIVSHGLYVSHKVIEICKKNNWEYILRYKEGCTSSIEKEYQAIPEKQKTEKIEYVNGVIFGEDEVNVLKYKETKIKRGEAVTTEFAWITSLMITEKNAEKLACCIIDI